MSSFVHEEVGADEQHDRYRCPQLRQVPVLVLNLDRKLDLVSNFDEARFTVLYTGIKRPRKVQLFIHDPFLRGALVDNVHCRSLEYRVADITLLDDLADFPPNIEMEKLLEGQGCLAGANALDERRKCNFDWNIGSKHDGLLWDGDGIFNLIRPNAINRLQQQV